MSTGLLEPLNRVELAPPLPDRAAFDLAMELGGLSDVQVYARSLTAANHAFYFLGRRNNDKLLGLLTREAANSVIHDQFIGASKEISVQGTALTLTVCDLTAANAAALRQALPFLNPRPLGLRKSAGCGDRLGLATPGHIHAVRHSTMAPILAQQSVRENARTGRTPQIVMDDAMWGAFQEGWREGFGADADHLKTTDDIDSFAAAGFTFYTIDPGEHVDNGASSAPVEVLRQTVTALPWAELETDWDTVRQELGSHPVDLGDVSLDINEVDLLRAAAKYTRVILHTVKMYRHLEQVMNGKPFELEMSVDETQTVTTPAEHIFIAHELRRMGVKWVSLAPRYVGTFEKGVDYIGDLTEFEQSFALHVSIARAFGPYKLSLHSGSDKFRIYPVVARLAGELVHLKTAGTSYLEALRTIAQVNRSLFLQIVAFARERYPIDRASYHVSADVGKVPESAAIPGDRLMTLLDDFHAREVLHVTFGSVLHHSTFREPFFSTLTKNEAVYHQMLETHFNKHFALFG